MKETTLYILIALLSAVVWYDEYRISHMVTTEWVDDYTTKMKSECESSGVVGEKGN